MPTCGSPASQNSLIDVVRLVLSDILRGTEEIAEQASRLATQTGSVPIDIIPAGRRPPNPGELLLGDRFAELLAWAEGEYDQVIVDAPPVLAGTDAAAVGRLCDGLMLVVRPEKNRRRVLDQSCRNLYGCSVSRSLERL